MPCGDFVELKMFEPAMRHPLDAYIRADDSKVLSTFDMTLVERPVDSVDSLP